MKLYIDTNILIYAIEDSKNLHGRDISSSSSQILWDVASCKHHVIISTWALTEVERIRESEKLKMLLKIIEKKTIIQRYTEEDIAKAKRQNPYHFHDELHGILALKANAEYIVTRNIDDFKHFKRRIKIVRPEFLLETDTSQ